MASAMRVFRKFQSSDGRVKAITASGVLALAAVVALAVGVLPAVADHETSKVESDFVQYGGGSGACAFVESDAEFEAHDNNPATEVIEGPDGTEISIEVDGNLFDFKVLTPGMAVYDVVVNGGPHNNHYDYDGDVNVGLVIEDFDLHAPRKQSGDLNNLSHINLCYDAAIVTFDCDGAAESAFRFEDGTFAGVTGQIFNNSVLANCVDEKSGVFFIDNGDDPNTKLDFGNEGDPVAGRLNVTKVFVDENGDPDPASFEPLEYSQTLTSEQVELSWCEVRDEADGDLDEDGNHPFDDFLPDGKYPSLIDVTDTFENEDTAQATACKVYEEENASGIQFTVVYFEFEDPHFY